MMNTTVVLDPPAAAAPADGISPAPLAGLVPIPGLVMGDSAVPISRRHEWPGRLFAGLASLTAVGCAIGVVALACFATLGMEIGTQVWKPMAGAAVLGVLQWRLAREVRRFSRWGWIGAMAELGGAAVAKVAMAVMVPATIPSALVALAVNGAWMRYFWNRRAQFDIDLGG